MRNTDNCILVMINNTVIEVCIAGKQILLCCNVHGYLISVSMVHHMYFNGTVNSAISNNELINKALRDGILEGPFGIHDHCSFLII